MIMLSVDNGRDLNFTFLPKQSFFFLSSHETYHWTNRSNGPNNRETHSRRARLYHLFLFETFTIKEEMFSIIKFIRGQLYNSESLTGEEEKSCFMMPLAVVVQLSESLRIGTTVTTVRHQSIDIQQNYEVNSELNFTDEIRFRRILLKEISRATCQTNYIICVMLQILKFKI